MKGFRPASLASELSPPAGGKKKPTAGAPPSPAAAPAPAPPLRSSASARPSPRMTSSDSPLAPAAPLYDTALYPAYQVSFSHSSVGRHIHRTKRVATFAFGYSDRDALERGMVGPDARGSEHMVELVWSVLSGKVVVTFDGTDVGGRAQVTKGNDGVSVSWEMGGPTSTADRSSGSAPAARAPGAAAGNGGVVRHTCHLFRVVAHLYPIGGNSMTAHPGPGNRQYDLFLDGRSFFDLPAIYMLGLDSAAAAGVGAAAAKEQKRAPPPPQASSPRQRERWRDEDRGAAPTTPASLASSSSSSSPRAGGTAERAVHGAYSFGGSVSRESVSPRAPSGVSPDNSGVGSGGGGSDPFSSVLLPGLENEEPLAPMPATAARAVPPSPVTAAVTAAPLTVTIPAPISPPPMIPAPFQEPLFPTDPGAATPMPLTPTPISMPTPTTPDGGAGATPTSSAPAAAPRPSATPEAESNKGGAVAGPRSSGRGGGMSLSDFASVSMAGHARELKAKAKKKDAAAAAAAAAASPSLVPRAREAQQRMVPLPTGTTKKKEESPITAKGGPKQEAVAVAEPAAAVESEEEDSKKEYEAPPGESVAAKIPVSAGAEAEAKAKAGEVTAEDEKEGQVAKGEPLEPAVVAPGSQLEEDEDAPGESAAVEDSIATGVEAEAEAEAGKGAPKEEEEQEQPKGEQGAAPSSQPGDEAARDEIEPPRIADSPTDDAAANLRVGGGGRLPPPEAAEGETVQLRHVSPPPSPGPPDDDGPAAFDGPEHGPPASPPSPPSSGPRADANQSWLRDGTGASPRRPAEIGQSWLRPAPKASPRKPPEKTDESYLLNHAKCALCCRDASDVMVDCECGRECGRKAHASCLLGSNRSNPVPSVSHPCTPAPALPRVLCGGIFAAR